MSNLLAEFLGTAILLLLGIGVNANTSLKNTIGNKDSGWVLVSMAWGLSVFIAVFITGQFSGAHLNPAVTVGLAIAGKFSWSLVSEILFVGSSHRMEMQKIPVMLCSFYLINYWNHTTLKYILN